AMKDYAEQLVGQLPDHGVILCDSDEMSRDIPRKLILAEAVLAGQNRLTNYFFLDTVLLKYPGYHKTQSELHPGEWPRPVNVKSFEAVDDLTLINTMAALSERQPVFYLHPSFGYYFEFFYTRPHGLTIEMLRCPTNDVTGPPLTEADITENETFWEANR